MSGLAAAMGAIKYIPASLGVKLLQKANPKFKSYFSTAAAYGFDATRALDYLKERFENEAAQTYKGKLETGAQQGSLRPDEAVSRSQLSNAALPGQIGRAALGFGGAAIAGRGSEGQAEQTMAQQQPQPQPINPQGGGQAQPQPQRKQSLIQNLEAAHEAEYGEAAKKNRLIQLTEQGLSMLQSLNRGG